MNFWLNAIRGEGMTKFLAQGHKGKRNNLCGYNGPIGREEGLGIFGEFFCSPYANEPQWAGEVPGSKVLKPLLGEKGGLYG